MKRKPEIWIIVILEALFALCATSVLVYRAIGRAFDFPWISYRVFNIVISIAFIVYLIYAMLHNRRKTLVFAAWFSLFHFIEGIIISFWFKVVIHAGILITLVWYYIRYKTLTLDGPELRGP